ncbi:MAG TPA: hypothetical protein VK447_19265 [Myxococcaceae bacterium]|nr:hypothetical protein [Myxococcaceae bacterium]
MKRLLFLVALALCPAALAQGAGKEAKPAGSVNWQGQVLKATGSGAPDMRASSAAQARLGAETAAKMDALRNLISQARGIRISSDKTVGDAMAKEEIRGRVEGVIRGYRISDKRYFSDQGVELDVEVPLAAISSVVNAAEPTEAIAVKTDGEPTHTGLVVDARGLGVKPALSPKLLDGEGKALYSAGCLSEEARKQKAPASYFPSLDSATGHKDLVGAKPLVVKASKASGSDLVLDAEAAKLLVSGNNAYLAEGRVAIVTDQR